MGTYAMLDSITGPPTLEWEFSSYLLTVGPAECGEDNLSFTNYSGRGVAFNPEGEICNGVINVFRQELDDIIVRETSGYFTNDSLYLDIEFENAFGEVFFGTSYGIKQ